MAMFAPLLGAAMPLIGSLLGGLGGGGGEEKKAPTSGVAPATPAAGPTVPIVTTGQGNDPSASGLAAIAGTAAGGLLGGLGGPAGGLMQAGQLATTLSGHPVITRTPQVQAATVQNAHNTLAAPQQHHMEQVGRAQVQRVTQALDPQLASISSQLTHRANQVQATAEHRAIEAEQAFQKSVQAKLDTIQKLIRSHHKASMRLRTY